MKEDTKDSNPYCEIMTIMFLTFLCYLLMNAIRPKLKCSKILDNGNQKQVWAVYLASYGDNETYGYAGGWYKKPCKCKQDQLNNLSLAYFEPFERYSSSNISTITIHIEYIEKSGIDAILVPWTSMNISDTHNRSKHTVDMLFNIKIAHKFHIGAMINDYQGRNLSTLKTEIEYYLYKYGNHTSILKIGDRPVIVIYDSHKFENVFEFQKILTHFKESKYNPLFMTTLIKSDNMHEAFEIGFEGFITYFVAEGETYGSLVNDWKGIDAFCQGRDVFFVPTIAPGFHDLINPIHNRHRRKERNNGTFYESRWKEAEKYNPTVILINSFNNWAEGTNLEPAVQFEYPNDSMFYIEKTRELANKFKNSKFSKL